MSMTNPDRIELNQVQQQRLLHLIRAGTTAQQLAQRARIVDVVAEDPATNGPSHAEPDRHVRFAGGIDTEIVELALGYVRI